MTERNLMTIVLVDEDKNLPVEKSLVAKFDDVLTEDDVETTIRQLLVDKDIKEVLSSHNEKRKEIVNKTILERTGNEVKLQPITIKDLTWKVK